MNIIISGKNFTPSKSNKQFVQEKLMHLAKFDASIFQIRAELDADKKVRKNEHFRVEVWVEGKKHYQAGAQGKDLFLTVEEVTRKLRAQIAREKKKIRTKRRVRTEQ